MAPSQPSLTSNRVFVVQCRRSPTGAPAGYDGRVEPLVSGQVARFHALEALRACMTWALADMVCTPPQGGQRPRAVEVVALEGLIRGRNTIRVKCQMATEKVPKLVDP